MDIRCTEMSSNGCDFVFEGISGEDRCTDMGFLDKTSNGKYVRMYLHWFALAYTFRQARQVIRVIPVVRRCF